MLRLLCLDAGSSSLKFAEYCTGDAGDVALVTRGETPAVADARESLRIVLDRVESPRAKRFDAVGHRIVFGGPRYELPTIATTAVLDDLETLVAIEPLHLRTELDLVYSAGRELPGAVNVLCFDTAFHRRSPAIAKKLPLPRNVDPLIERYGFHGLSYEYVSSKLPANARRTVIAHLGSGASLCALHNEVPIDTTMGFSALGGLMMSTRPGDLDPGVVLRLLSNGYDLERLTDLLYRKSGLLGVSGSSAGMKELLERSLVDSATREAVELFIYQLVKHLGAMIAVLGGLDTLVFTGGIGENAPEIRSRACAAFGYLGVRLEERANGANEQVISTSRSRVSVYVIPTDETLMIARHAAEVIRN